MKDATDFLTGAREIALMVGEVLGVLFFGVIIGVWGAIRKNKSMIKWSHTKEKRMVDHHSRIHELLTEMRVTVRACRCLVFQFHNGGCFADGTSINRFSVTHESCDEASQSMILESQDVLLTRYMDIVSILEFKSGKIIAVNSLPPSAFRSGLEINSVEYFSVVPLKCLDGLTPLGFLCCHWCSADALDEIEREGVSQERLETLIQHGAHEINSHLAYKAGKN